MSEHPHPASLMAQFEDLYGAPADGVWSAPGRVNLIGEHTDYNGGLALPIAIPQRTDAAVRLRDDRRLRLSSDISAGQVVEVDLDDIHLGMAGGWVVYPAGVWWSAEQAGHLLTGADVLFGSDVPVGSGLSSSAALECSVAAALDDLFELGLIASDAGRATLASWCQRAENDVAGAPTGGMDQAASMRTTAGHAILLDSRSGAVEQVPVDLEAHGLALLVVDTRAEHSHVDGQYAQRRATCEEAAQLLGVSTLREVSVDELGTALAALPTDVMRSRVQHVVTEIARVTRCVEALHRGDFDEVGRLFTASHASLRDDYEVSCRELDLVVDTALAEGALGARMTGGGFGGSAIALVRADEVEAVAQSVAAAFADADLVAPQAFSVVAGPPAGRDA